MSSKPRRGEPDFGGGQDRPLGRGRAGATPGQEVRALSMLEHPGLVRLLDTGVTGGQAYLVMELVTGSTLAESLSSGPFGPSRTADIGIQLARALAYVHGRGIVHRDVKPSNILMGADGAARLGDFGIARLIGRLDADARRDDARNRRLHGPRATRGSSGGAGRRRVVSRHRPPRVPHGATGVRRLTRRGRGGAPGRTGSPSGQPCCRLEDAAERDARPTTGGAADRRRRGGPVGHLPVPSALGCGRPRRARHGPSRRA